MRISLTFLLVLSTFCFICILKFLIGNVFCYHCLIFLITETLCHLIGKNLFKVHTPAPLLPLTAYPLSPTYRQNSPVFALGPNSAFLSHGASHSQKVDPNYETVFSSLTTTHIPEETLTESLRKSGTPCSTWSIPSPYRSHQGLSCKLLTSLKNP